MLIKMNPVYISNNWNELYEMLKPALFNPGELVKTNLLRAVLTGIAQCWFCSHDDVGVGIVVTNFSIDSFSGLKDLVIYAVVTGNNSTLDDWNDSLNTLTEYARSQGCKRVVAFSNNSKLVRFLKRLNADAMNFISWEV